MRLIVEVEGQATPLTLPGDGAGLAAFCSFCVVRGFGAQHPLIEVAERLDLEYAVRIGPFTHFYDATIEDAEDAEKIEMAWQEPATLEASASQAARALRDDPALAQLAAQGGAAELAEQMAMLAQYCGSAGEAGSRIRMSYVL